MLIEWMSWIRSFRANEFMLILGVLLLVDAPRYALSSLAMAAWDLLRNGLSSRLPGPHSRSFDYCPSVSVLIAGYNERDSIYRTMDSVWDTYPNMQLIVVCDGSTDGMEQEAQRFADEHPDVIVVKRDRRGGKSSALNLALHYATGEVIVTVDADSRVNSRSIWELVQPLENESVAAVSATVLAWNAFTNFATWLQAYEYRQTIFLNRMLKGRLGILGIVSGAFGAFRADVLRQVGAWDVGPGEDGDLALRIRKAGYRIGVAPYALCYSNVPTSWRALFKQRCRWDRTVITFECRKHGDLGMPWKRNFRANNLMLLLERWFFNVVCVYTFWLYGLWVLFVHPAPTHLLMLLYCCGLCVELLQGFTLLYYTDSLRRDLALSAIILLYPLYQVFMKAVDVYALTEEIFFHSSNDDNFVPAHVRRLTWRW